MISRRFDNRLQILEVTYSENISLDDILSFGKWIANNQELPRELKILTDASEAVYQISGKDYPILMEALAYNCLFYKSVKAAYIQQKPIETAYSTLVSKNDIPGYLHAVFYTREAALAWLLGE